MRQTQLSVDVPSYVIEYYIDSCYNDSFDINIILPIDFKAFLNTIEQCPTKILSIDLLEIDLIAYINKNDFKIDQEIFDSFTKYKLNVMYLYLQNK